MGLDLVNLDEETRRFMLEEVERDIAIDELFISTRLNGSGVTAFPGLLKAACQEFNDEWLARELRDGLLNETLQARKPRGTEYYAKKMPFDAPDTLAEGEFNRFYARGLCKRALVNGIPELEIYRAKAVLNPRSASQAKIGSTISAEALLADLRTSQGMDTALGLPPGPNSGLSVKLP
jgi:hypothetical protein